MSPSGLVVGDDGRARCAWGDSVPAYRPYHDGEWGFPAADDRRLFEKLSLEGFQAGLAWLTILRKREAFREVFADFDFRRVAGFGQSEVAALLQDARIIRHRGKIEAVINNAQRAVELVEREGSGRRPSRGLPCPRRRRGGTRELRAAVPTVTAAMPRCR